MEWRNDPQTLKMSFIQRLNIGTVFIISKAYRIFTMENINQNEIMKKEIKIYSLFFGTTSGIGKALYEYASNFAGNLGAEW